MSLTLLRIRRNGFRLVILKADERSDVDEPERVIWSGFRSERHLTGDTLCDDNAPVILESLFIPEPVISVAVEPKTKQDMDKLSKALQSLSEEDPTFRVHVENQPNRDCRDGRHLEILVDRMLREFKVEANVGVCKSLTGKQFANPSELKVSLSVRVVVRASMVTS